MPQYLSADKEKELVETAQLLMTKGKGLLAADESTGNYDKTTKQKKNKLKLDFFQVQLVNVFNQLVLKIMKKIVVFIVKCYLVVQKILEITYLV